MARRFAVRLRNFCVDRDRWCARGGQLVWASIARCVRARFSNTGLHIAGPGCFAPATAHFAGALRFTAISKWRLANRRRAYHWRSRQSRAVAVDGSDLHRTKSRKVEEKPDSNLRLGRFFLECEHIDKYLARPECKLSADLRFAAKPVRAKPIRALHRAYSGRVPDRSY